MNMTFDYWWRRKRRHFAYKSNPKDLAEEAFIAGAAQQPAVKKRKTNAVRLLGARYSYGTDGLLHYDP